MKQIIVALALTLVASTANAGRLLILTDSIGLTGFWQGTPWPTLFLAQRPDMTMCNNAVLGRTSQQGVDAINAAIDSCGNVTDVLVILGVNDPLQMGETDPRETAKRLRTIANRIRNKGAVEWIGTPIPATNNRGTPVDHQWFTRELRGWLYRMNGSGPAYNILDVRDAFTGSATPWVSCAPDGIHPDGVACRQTIADFVAAVFP